MPISIIVPVYNEASLIAHFLRHLRERAPAAEIIVVDGGSSDATPRIAGAMCDHFVQTEAGRARQMNAGARIAGSDVFWFLHADTEVPWDCVQKIGAALRDPKAVGGFFRIQLPRDRIVYRLTDSFAHYAGMALRIRCGDHGFFCRHEIFAKIGGFPEVPLMEDVDFFRSLRRIGRVVAVRSRLRLSPRRYEAVGPARLTLAYGVIALFYALGVSRRWLQWLYDVACSSGSGFNPAANTCGSRSKWGLRKRSA